MKKKALSLALALVMCLGLTAPAFAAEAKEGDTAVTVTDATGLSITLKLSNGILGTETMAAGDGGGTNVTVYTVPSGTTITPSIPGASWKDGIFNGDMLSNPSFVGTAPDGETWEGEYGVEFACQKPTGGAGFWTEGDYFSESISLSDGTCVIVCEHYFSTQSADELGTARESSRIYFRVSDEKPADPNPTTPPAETIPASGTAKASTQTVTVDGKAVEFQMYALVDENGNGTNYIKLRDMAYVLNGTKAQFSVGYDNATKSISVTSGQGYEKQPGDLAGAPAGGSKTAEPSNDAIYINGEKVAAEVYKIDGSNYFKLRDLGKALDFYVGWSKEAGVFIQTDKPYSE